jgi:hypothetical protein
MKCAHQPVFDDGLRLCWIADADALDVFASSGLIASIISFNAK